MDASAYLQKQGWRGDGHSLDHSDRGIKKPLLVSKKVDVLGVGLNKHKAVSDQWWLRAFDQGLKTFGTGQESALGAVQKHGVNRGGLYARFIRGEGVPGSMGQSPVTGSEAGTGANTPVEVQDGTMFVDVPPRDKLERTVGEVQGKSDHDAMMALPENPANAPAGMQKMLDKKRKRTETHEDKRARRKVERSEKRKEHARDKQEAGNEVDEKAVRRQANEYVLEAQQRGILPFDTNAKAKGKHAGAISVKGEPSAEFVAIMARAGLDTLKPCAVSVDTSEKAQRYTREKMQREVKRAAKAYLSGERGQSEETAEERKARRAEKKALTAEKKAAAAQEEAERLAGRADEQVKIDQYRAMKRGISLESHRKTLPNKRQVAAPVTQKKRKLRREKLEQYSERARLKGVTLQEYMRRRDEKFAAKQAEKQGHRIAPAEPTKVPGKIKPPPATNGSVPVQIDDGLGFVVDTVGDGSLAVKPPAATTSVELDDGDDHDDDATAPLPLDPTLWQGIKPKDMPKAMRKARQHWMRARRDDRKARQSQLDTKTKMKKKKDKGQRKIEARENFARQILQRSREELLAGGKGGGSGGSGGVTIDGVPDVPLVEVASREGGFKKDEVKLARTSARRVLRGVKREERAKKGRG